VAGVVHIPWYATLLRGELFADAAAEMAPVSLRYGATRYAVHRSQDDRYKVHQMFWFESKDDWYRFWDSPELIEFRARYSGKYQVPVSYVWHDELAAGELGPEVPVAARPAPDNEPEPQAAA
jgi:hypothetical protein